MKKVFKIFSIAVAAMAFIACGKDKGPDPEKPKETHFTFEVKDITKTSATISIKRDDESLKFYYAFPSASILKTFGDDFKTAATKYYEGEIDFYVNMGFEREEALNGLLRTEDLSEMEISYLNAGTEYHLIALYADDEGNVVGDPEEYVFNTVTPEKSNNTFELTISKVEARTVSVRVIPSIKEESYMCAAIKLVDYEGISAEDLPNAILANYVFDAPIYSGDLDTDINVYAGYDYAIAIFGYDSGYATTGVTLKEFTTPAAGDPAAWDFTCRFEDNPTMRGFKTDYYITPNDNSLDYMSMVVNAKQNGRYVTAEEFRAAFVEDLQNMIDNGTIPSAQVYFQLFAGHGPTYGTELIYPGDVVKVAAFTVNVETGEVGEFKLSQEYVQPIPPRSTKDVKVSVDYDKYYNGDEIVALNPDYSFFAGGAVVPFHINKPEDAYGSVYYGAFAYQKSYDTLSDYDILGALIQNGTMYDSEAKIPFDTDAILYYAYLDEDGCFGEIGSKIFKLSKEGASPAQEYLDSQVWSANTASVKKDDIKKISLYKRENAVPFELR